jgi:hypothetical protein
MREDIECDETKDLDCQWPCQPSKPNYDSLIALSPKTKNNVSFIVINEPGLLSGGS